jgi:peptide subunit release factor 1 (eRF1)
MCKPQLEALDDIAMFHLKQDLDALDKMSGRGTSLLSLLIPGSTQQFHQMRQKLTTELGAAANIKDRANRQSV